MGIQKPSIPKGTRDFSPAEMMRRNYIFDSIRQVFRTFGFAPLETPAMENLSTLLGKYGDEGDKLLFKILNSGDYAAGLLPDELRQASRICEKGLRYDLTVPFARYVVQHQGELALPFKRYQIQPVWRADRPQKGGYREFYQCDVDVVGSRSLLNEVELVEIVERVFRKLRIAVTLKMNNRKILYGHCRDDRPCRQDGRHHGGHRQTGEDRHRQREGRTARALHRRRGDRQTSTDSRAERR